MEEALKKLAHHYKQIMKSELRVARQMWMQELEIKKMNCKSVGVQHGAMTTVVDYSPLYYLLTNRRWDDYNPKNTPHQTTDSPVACSRRYGEHSKSSCSPSTANNAMDSLLLTSVGKTDCWGNMTDDCGNVLDQNGQPIENHVQDDSLAKSLIVQQCVERVNEHTQGNMTARFQKFLENT